jgi:hypothetical protein
MKMEEVPIEGALLLFGGPSPVAALAFEHMEPASSLRLKHAGSEPGLFAAFYAVGGSWLLGCGLIHGDTECPDGPADKLICEAQP